MKIVFISDGNPVDNSLWSGTIKQMYTKLKMEHEVIVVDVRNCSKLLMTFNKCLTRMVKIVSKKKYNATYSILSLIHI